MLKRFSKFLFIFLFILFSGFLAFSLNTNAASPSSISVDINPENPAPNENVTITLSSYASNLDSVDITWSVNNKSTLSGIGKKSFSINAPGVGGEISVTAIIALPDGNIEKRVTIRPSVMIMLWEATDSYVPPFYKGKAMPTMDSEIKIVAMPEIRTSSGIVNPKNMTYSWKKDYMNEQGASGYGKNYFIYVNDYLEDSNTIGVTTSTIDQNYSSSASIEVGVYQPKILFYKNDASLGTVWEHALPNGHKIVGEEIIEAAPYFISPGDIRIPTLLWSWFINDSLVSTIGLSKNLMPVKVPEGTTGASKIRLEINNVYKLYENTTKEIDVIF